MLTRKETLKNLIRVAVLANFALVAACGGGGGDDASPPSNDESSGPGVVACIILTLATNQLACGSSGSSSPPSSSPPSSTPPPSTPPTSAGAALVIRHNNEFEPNGDLGNANLPSSPTRNSPDQEIGWNVDGSIDDVTDITDTFAFTPNQTRNYSLALCPPKSGICNGNTGIDTLTAFFRVLDQDGNVLLTSEADTINGNRHGITLDAGVLYYVTVDAGDTMGVTVGYRIFVYETS
jgi:hypothetical protein